VIKRVHLKITDDMKVENTSINDSYGIMNIKNISSDDNKTFSNIKKRKVPAPAIGQGQISIYDSLFIKYAPEAGLDWRLLAAIACQESRFIATASSGKNTGGLMGIIPATAKIFLLPQDSIFDPEANLKVAVSLIKRLNSSFYQVKDKDEKLKFIVAAYNAGSSHINDARALTQKYGMNPYKWDDVAEFMKRLYDPSFYNDKICRIGAFNANITLNYVEDVFERWDIYKLITNIQNVE
jgi:membrane-bound lytic murein transglycosylase F